jgi:hypothetical protein
MEHYPGLFFGDDELNINPPTPCQIGKRPPEPKTQQKSAASLFFEMLEVLCI